MRFHSPSASSAGSLGLRRPQRGFTLVEILVSISIVAALMASALLLVPKGMEMSRRSQCASNLADLGALYQLQRMEQPGRSRYDGAAVLLALRAESGAVRFGDEDKFLCPGDPQAVFPRSDPERQRWSDVDLGNVPDGLCSYAARDFSGHPFGARGRRKEVLATDRQGDDGRTPHHDGGLNVLYDDGAVKFLRRADLGLESSDPIVVGAASEHPELGSVAVRVGVD